MRTEYLVDPKAVRRQDLGAGSAPASFSPPSQAHNPSTLSSKKAAFGFILAYLLTNSTRAFPLKVVREGIYVLEVFPPDLSRRSSCATHSRQKATDRNHRKTACATGRADVHPRNTPETSSPGQHCRFSLSPVLGASILVQDKDIVPARIPAFPVIKADVLQLGVFHRSPPGGFSVSTFR